MRVATYNRKSVYSDHSDSVGNQERMCREHARLRFGEEMESFEAYQDEGFTGANTDRPGLKRLLSDIDAGKIDVLVVYQMDRISRSVKDFADIWDRLEKKGVSFISIKENFDTDTPMGRAMIYITMVFAQMERETIAERVTDNARGLAMKGFWLGGTPPTGYKIATVESDGKRHRMLSVDPESAEFVKMIYRDFLELGKASKSLADMYARNGVKSITGKRLDQAQIYGILKRPVYCEATKDVYDFLSSSGYTIAGPGRDAWDGKHGVMVYGKTSQKVRNRMALTPRDSWVVSLGAHDPIISAKDWLAAQERISANVFVKTGSQPPTLLKGIVRCAFCGRLMQVRRPSRNGKTDVYYGCQSRIMAGPETCRMRYVKAEVLDGGLMEKIREAVLDQNVMDGFYASSIHAEEYREAISVLEKRIAAADRKLQNLSQALAEAGESAARKYIISELGKTDAERCKLEEEKNALERKAEETEGMGSAMERNRMTIENLVGRYEEMDAWTRNKIMKELITKCTWDGETLRVLMSN